MRSASATLIAASTQPSTADPVGGAGPARTAASLGPVSRDDDGRDRASCTSVFDGHNDLPWALRKHFESDLGRADLTAAVPELQTALRRLRAGNVGAQFWSVF